jgi:N-acyl homoserine lactone hydrolase
MSAADIAVRRVDFGCFIRPGEETASGVDRAEPVIGYLVEHPHGTLLVDTGMGAHPDVDAHYRPSRVALTTALAGVDTQPDDVTAVANCHLHFDHCGGNPDLLSRPVFVQAVELVAANVEGYTLPELVEPQGIRYEELSGEAEIWPGVLVVPTPGHTDGHQSVVVRQGDGTVIVIAGQSHDSASDYSADVLALRALDQGHATSLTAPPAWMRLLNDLDPRRVYFAHDHAVWTPE